MLNSKGFRTVSIAGFLSSAAYSLFDIPFAIKNALFLSSSTIPSLDKGKHACQHVLPALFVLFALAGASPPASQKPKITRKYIAGGCGAVLPEQKCVQTRKGPQRILAVLSRGLTQYGRISARQNRVCPCQSMVSYLSNK